MSWQAALGIGLSILGIVISIATLGIGIKAGIALNFAGASLLVGSVLGVASGSLGIASSALESRNPQLSSSLGWASLGLGIGSAVAGISGAVVGKVASMAANLSFPAQVITGSRTTSVGVAVIKQSSQSTRVLTHGSRFSTELNFAGKGIVSGNTFGAVIAPHLATKNPIHLFSCYAGFGGKLSPAQLIANQTGRTVMASTRIVTENVSHLDKVFHPLTGLAKTTSNLAGGALSHVAVNRSHYLALGLVVGGLGSQLRRAL
ncbi:hypothetical protein ABHV50_000704 [Vibrio vulnificus]|nr:hypothetical protein [Vibrio vulnificus]HDU8729664.1 hypothetical protein [Vibrio vulnificus]HDU8764707.1 hypothetical protein [Vibrio vulnificus]